jgi:hypothetical protein
MKWIDNPDAFTSRGSDGAKIGGFFFKGNKMEWWVYPPGYQNRGLIKAMGPFGSLSEAKVAYENH